MSRVTDDDGDNNNVTRRAELKDNKDKGAARSNNVVRENETVGCFCYEDNLEKKTILKMRQCN